MSLFLIEFGLISAGRTHTTTHTHTYISSTVRVATVFIQPSVTMATALLQDQL